MVNIGVTINRETCCRSAKKHIKILIIDEYRLICDRLRRMLEEEDDIRVVGTCSSAEEAFSEIVRLCPDIVLMGVKMPGMNSIEATKSLKRNGLNYDGDVIVLVESDNYGVQALEAGAATYVLKDTTRLELTESTRQVYQSRHVPEDSLDFVYQSITGSAR